MGHHLEWLLFSPMGQERVAVSTRLDEKRLSATAHNIFETREDVFDLFL